MKPYTPPQLLATAYLPNQLLSIKGPTVLLLGRSNVGKSSFINALFKKKMAKTAKAPGKTRSINYYRWAALTLVDLPGYGYAKRSQEERQQWQVLIQNFFEKLSSGTMALLLMDAKRDLEAEEFQLIEALQERAFSIVLLLTKSDRLVQRVRQERSRYLQNLFAEKFAENALTFHFVSAKTGEGVDTIYRRLLKYAQAFKTETASHASR